MFSVLVVDPDPAAPSRWTPQLEAEGYRVVIAADAESALIAFEEHLPQLVIVDADLDGLSGKEVCDAIKKRTGDMFVPVMLVATPQADGDKSSVFDAGADEFVTKPIDARELSARLRSLQKIYSIANRNQSEKLVSTFLPGQGGDEEIIKTLADRMAANRALLFRFSAGEQTAYLATDGLRIIHARLGKRSGRDALHEVLCWPAGEFVCVEAALEPALDADLGGLVGGLLAGVDHWRLFSERLAPQTILRLNPLRSAALELLPRVEAETARAFAEPQTIDAFVRGAPGDWLTAARTLAALYYRGILLREGAAAEPWRGSPLVLSAAAPAATGDSQEAEELQLEVLSLNAALSKAAEEATALKTKLAQATQEAWRETSARESALKMAEARAAELDAELIALKRRYATRLKDLANTAGGDVMDSVIEQLSRDLQDAHSFAVSVQNAKNLAEKQAAALREEVGALKYALEESTGTIDWLKQQQQTSLEQGGSKLQTLQLEIAALKAELAHSGAQRESLLEQLNGVQRGAAASSELDEMRTKLAAAERLAAAQAAELRDKAAELERLRPLAAELPKTHADLTQAVQAREAAERAAKDAKAACERAVAETLALRSALAERDANPAGADPALIAKLGGLENEVAALRESGYAAEAAATQLSADLAEANRRLAVLTAETDGVRGELADALRLRTESAALAAAHAERVAELASRAAELEATLAAQTAAVDAAAARERNVASEQATAESGLEEEIALLKAALTEAMVASEQLQSERDAAVRHAEERVRKLDGEVFTLVSQLSQAQEKSEILEQQLAAQHDGDTKRAQLEKEIAFLKARLEEAAASEAEARRRLEEDLAALKAKLGAAARERKQLEERLASSTASQSQADLASLESQLVQLRAQNAALEQKLHLAMEGHQRNTLLVKAQDQADLVQTLKVSLRQREAEIAALREQTEAPAESAAEQASAEAALQSANAEIEALKKKVDALRMSLLERDEEIVDLSARLQGGESVASALDEVPD